MIRAFSFVGVITLIGCAASPISEQLQHQKYSDHSYGWIGHGSTTVCGSMEVADFSLKLSRSGVWETTYILKNFDVRKNHWVSSELVLEFYHDENDIQILALPEKQIPSGVYKKVNDKGEWAGSVNNFSKLSLSAVRLVHRCGV